MYVPKLFEERDLEVLHALIRAHSLGTWVTEAEGALAVNHIPFLLDATRGEYGTLVAHVARANDIWQSFARHLASVVIFQGPQTYITPSWYATKRATGKAVPTWNYAVVHAHGIPRAIEDRDWLLNHVTALSNFHEAGRAVPWSVADAPPDFIESLLANIVGIEIPINTLVGKWKTSQNRSLPDKHGIIAGLHERADDNAKQMAALVNRHTG
jgi:transcriptional regulator